MEYEGLDNAADLRHLHQYCDGRQAEIDTKRCRALTASGLSNAGVNRSSSVKCGQLPMRHSLEDTGRY